MNESIELSLQYQFQAEKLRRTIQECNDIDLLKRISIQLLELNKKKTSIAQIASKMAFEAEQRNLNDSK
ncbi:MULTISPECIES: hypothetical protein [Prochlorococcus]|uniref:Uncharacterized protein n=1 Tax=Prochlorococcus marinus (strain SARG / CCMP1375 / SS120) TaxID=167539 RepID=Q7VEE4_PROMA|nr:MULTISPECIES: hypothetical protein [Prochlorococcus]AAP99115.1 Predicted protein [Prochlorococcus marinus subsp. marinus str. CCMP1375]KGG11625.1 hypothetical protein EV04_0912 [Prochlorococcus marinus str. LG]KGG22367.1 hypothetical protein EV08_0185 [Prochlorococcus marinus str. SS2]KGG22703.1 hypothetical protein EV09_1442 [Prochlorococcus marinus str. SS35]KGG32876.1 hypothetical protein EV10_0856 [Prochlorococcus marinus str. SS51]